MKKRNCWEYKRCGREPGGNNADELGVCPATTEKRLDGTFDGKNAGRACWVVAGTMCKGTVQGTYAQKLGDCGLCEFYQLVKQEEGKDFLVSVSLIKKIDDEGL